MADDVKPLDFSKLLQPGAEIPEELEPGRVQGTGQAHGVIYLIDKVAHLANNQVSIVARGKFREALRYLKGQSANWLAVNPGKRGRTHIEIHPIMNLNHNHPAVAHITKTCQKTGQSIASSFFTCNEVAEAFQPENIGRWHIVPAPTEGVWCVFFI